MIGVEQWAEIRRLYFVEKRSKRAIHRVTGVHRDTISGFIDRGQQSGDFVLATLPKDVQRPGAIFAAAPGKQYALH